MINQALINTIIESLNKKKAKQAYFCAYRDLIGENFTAGKWFIEDIELFYTLEDKLRGYGEKIPGQTCYPATYEKPYNITVSFSNRFKKEMPIIYTENDKQTLISNGVKFIGVRCHGGTDIKDTDGCTLCAYNRVDADNDGIKDELYGRASDDLTILIKKLEAKGFECKLFVFNHAK